jgi:hypothetical protein
MHYGYGMSYAETGKEVGISNQAVAKEVHRNLRTLRRCLEGSAVWPTAGDGMERDLEAGLRSCRHPTRTRP